MTTTVTPIKTAAVKTAAEVEPPKAISQHQLRLWFGRNIAVLLFKILLPILDWGTDVYTLHRYYRLAENKPLMTNVFRASLFTILFHNAISTWHGIRGIKRFNALFPLATWSGNAWKSFTLVLHALGIGGVIVPVEAIFVIIRLDREAATQRYQ